MGKTPARGRPDSGGLTRMVTRSGLLEQIPVGPLLDGVRRGREERAGHGGQSGSRTMRNPVYSSVSVHVRALPRSTRSSRVRTDVFSHDWPNRTAVYGTPTGSL